MLHKRRPIKQDRLFGYFEQVAPQKDKLSTIYKISTKELWMGKITGTIAGYDPGGNDKNGFPEL
jgi:hypothetical protein